VGEGGDKAAFVRTGCGWGFGDRGEVNAGDGEVDLPSDSEGE
jgi:hypothetical protein